MNYSETPLNHNNTTFHANKKSTKWGGEGGLFVLQFRGTRSLFSERAAANQVARCEGDQERESRVLGDGSGRVCWLAMPCLVCLKGYSSVGGAEWSGVD